MQVLSKIFTPGVLLKNKTRKKYAGDLPGTVEIDTPHGVCLAKETVWPCPKCRISEDTIRDRCMQELTLVPGIGPSRAAAFRKKGCRYLTDLGHTVWSGSAYETADVIRNGSPSEIFGIFQDAHRANDPLLLGFSHALPGEELLYFDIETLGMFQSPIILFGCGFRKGAELTVVQYLLRDIEDEPAALDLTARLFHKHAHVVTYNGKSFDVPYLNSRLSYYGEKTVHPDLHFDLLYPTRRLYRDTLFDCCLGTVEKHILKKARADDLPGHLVPAYYQRYLQTGNVSNLMPIIKHNELDVANLALLLRTECEVVYG